MKNKPLSKKSIRMLRRIQRQIRKEPRQFHMDTFFTNEEWQVGHKIPNCGTSACIAGWAITLDRRVKPNKLLRMKKNSIRTMVRHGCKAIGITKQQAELMFFDYNWPDKFRVVSEEEFASPRRKATNAIKRIDHFIKTKGEE